ncbi:hypothetical protein [Streptomyces sp. MUM 203J]|uniref:hypothetical protein n=1 Tax=Streptomyces sp. MUM 203J TaxID=2791990 RepID=UPI001F0375D3|nr:hypothetical protein [Streptomyces sp. MUM 203J]
MHDRGAASPAADDARADGEAVSLAKPDATEGPGEGGAAVPSGRPAGPGPGPGAEPGGAEPGAEGPGAQPVTGPLAGPVRGPCGVRLPLLHPQAVLSWLPLPVAAALWGYALPRIGFRDIGDYGLLDRFPGAYYASLLVLTAGFVVSLRRAGTAPWWPAAHTVAVLVALKAPPALLYDSVRYAWAGKHDEVITRLLTEGTVHPYTELSGGMAAYDQWPGFFALNAALVRAFGVDGAAVYANWAPVVLGLLMLPVLVLLYRTFTEDWRLVWTGVWIFQLANWVGQDYLSPQGFSYLLFLTILTVVLRHFVRPGSAGPLRDRASIDPAAAPVPPSRTRRERALATLLLLPLVVTVNASHQLTPVMLCATLAVLCLTRRHRNLGLLAVCALVMAAWFLTMGRPLFLDTLGGLRDSLGDLLGNSRAGYAGDPTGPGPELVGAANIAMVLALAALAATAVLVRRRLVRSALPLLLASAAPLPMFAVNDYGGEMLFRVYLFGLPGTAFFAAAALVPAAGATGRAWRAARRATAVALPVALAALLAGFLPSYYGKEGMHYAPPGELALVRRAHDRAPDGALIMATAGSFPGAYTRYDHYERWFFTEQDVPENLEMLEDPARYLADGIPEGRPAYVILTATQEKAVTGEGYLPPGGFAALTEALRRSPLFRVEEENEHGVVLVHTP